MKHFFSAKDKNISEKTFWQGLIISAVSILLCVVAFSAGTYAWFVGDVTSNSNTLTSGSFDILARVTTTADEGAVVEIPKDEGATGWRYTLPADGEEVTYTVTLTLTEQATVKGHCIVTIGNDPARHTAPIIGASTSGASALSPDRLTNPFVFTVTITETTVITLEPSWGVSAADSVICHMEAIDLTPATEETTVGDNTDETDAEPDTDEDGETTAETDTEADMTEDETDEDTIEDTTEDNDSEETTADEQA